MTSTHPVTSPNLGGRTGDLDGNLNRVKRELRRIRFPVDFDAGAAREGNPMSLLPALHYALLGFSRHVTSSLVDAGHDLQAKSDARFVENAWRALREAFGYNPALSPSQFLSPGFAERKLMLLHDAIELCKRRHNEHARKKRAEETAAAVSREGVPRVARVAEKKIAETRDAQTTKGGGSGAESSEPFSPRDPEDARVAPRAFAITRHDIVRGGEARFLSKEREEEPSSAANPEPAFNGSDAESDFEFSRPSLASALATRPAREGARAPLGEVDAPVEPWFARSSGAAKRDALEATESKTDKSSLSMARAENMFPDENAPPAVKTNKDPAETNRTSQRSTYSDDEIIGLMTQRFSKRTDIEDEDEESHPRKGHEGQKAPHRRHADDESSEDSSYFTASAAKAFLAAFETRVLDAERRAAVAVDAARAAEAVASRAVAACQETVEQMMGERTRGAQLAAALAEQTAKSLLLEKRVRVLEKNASDASDALSNARDADRAPSSVFESEGRTNGGSRGVSFIRDSADNASSRVSLAAAKERASISRGVSSAGDFSDELTHITDGLSIPFGVRRDRDPPPHARSPKPAPTETGAFIDFYSGVLGVDRAQLTLKR